MTLSSIAFGLIWPVAIVFFIMLIIQWQLLKFWKKQISDRKPLSIQEVFTRHGEFVKWFDWFQKTQAAALARMGNVSWEQMAKQAAQMDPRYRAQQYNKKSMEKMGKMLKFSTEYVFPFMCWVVKYGAYVLLGLLIVLLLLLVLAYCM